ncbi:ABC transporter substrate-binding protein [Streptomyces sp. NBC_01304]|uniref:ABC transporter substrate-binding protein n=1 Tax=Streptomyces sp. NBC_01304 TaxID=2903818 RepID=UPI002E0E2039|nr:ABC transporter substrate-binding protein [Streptomyces sp. NBC_01304]
MAKIPRRAAAAGALLLALALVLTACGTPAGSRGAADYRLSAGTPRPKGEISGFSWALYAEPPVLDYLYAFDYPQNTVLANVCESLMRWTPGLTTEPGLARKASNPDPKTWVYDLRAGVKFHGGGELTADDAVYSLRRHLDPKLGSYWNEDFANVASIDKTGPLQVTVRLKRPDALFPQAMANSAGTVASSRSIKAQGRKFGTADGGLDCTGPFELGRWNRGQSLRLDRFDGYWGRRAKAGHVTFTFLPDSSARTNALLTGEVDGTFGVPPESLARLRSSDSGTLSFGEGLTTVNLNVASLKGTLKDVRVRRALLLALDREGFARAAMRGSATPTSAPAPRAAWRGIPRGITDRAYRQLPTVKRDLETARKLIRQAGAEGKKLTVATSPIGPDVSLLALAVQDAGTRIGLNVELKTIAPDAFTALFSDAKAREGLDLFPYTYYLSITDPLGIYTNFRTGQFENYAHFSDPEYDRVEARASATYDPVKRGRITAQLQKLALDKAICLPVAEYPNAVFQSRRITGAPTTVSYLYYPWAADVGARG